jgi:hypothetical protein
MLVFTENTTLTGQTNESAQNQYHEASEPEWIDGRFVSLLSCTNCKGRISLAGKYRIQDDRGYDENGQVGDYERYYRPFFFSDSPHIIAVPDAVPDEVRGELTTSFRLFWVDLEAAANRLRSSLEVLLTHLGIRRTTGRRPDKKRAMLTLHSRIELLAAEEPDLAEHLMAVKWLGNAGSHSKPLTFDDLLDGYEVLDHVLNDVFVRRASKAHVIARAINRRKGPRSRRRGA